MRSNLSAAAAATFARAADELEVLHDDVKLAALSATLLVFPLIELEPPFDEDRLALVHVLVDDLGLLSEGVDLDEGDFLAVFTLCGAKLSVAGDAELGDGGL